MNGHLIAASVLTLLAFFVHTFIGDKELQVLEPNRKKGSVEKDTVIWTMSRCGWHWISFDLLFATLGLALITFTDTLTNEDQLLQIISVYFFGYGIVWLITLAISKSFPKNYVKLGQWILLWTISGLIFLGT
ncbi:hypothetical protein SAMN04490243_0766 [Robiginitalea myxolifaciens]|uniref:Uncharacterized protein n=1 Tax=Robiginitalea myxolifaciens TaxID=400055 RepID=A0A1I6FVQ9_9FLAO|nr:hypothetical protein [Robiginitalea myxolifaciens]SFR34014.1 hypothetical protein SAMN04490243_0766 [Robiginitalea myxolifaciens]